VVLHQEVTELLLLQNRVAVTKAVAAVTEAVEVAVAIEAAAVPHPVVREVLAPLAVAEAAVAAEGKRQILRIVNL